MSRLTIAALTLALLAAPVASATEYRLDPLSGSDTVHIESSARLEFLDGETQAIVGQFIFDPNQPQSAATAVLSVDLRTLKTGIDKRDEHMRQNHLHTDEFPHCYFELTSLEGMPQVFAVDSSYHAEAVGLFYIHGVKRAIEARLSIAPLAESGQPGSFRVRAEFEIRLDDFEIPRPRALFLKLAEVIEVTTVFTLHPGQLTTPIALPNWELKP
ncbi:MAG: YceI family protein [candidate division Zixibacteria bacterium]|nr:YceI family protein [candidate division Zixibacteria bacterium]MDH3936864.1 YceI family protein [candidate division Zixibacteria bacterium]MDH4033703.1 YceI family protein [candidate division Zixibacteria bacterium]